MLTSAGTMLLQVAAGRISDGGSGSTLLRVWDHQRAFGATLLWELEGAVAGLSIDGAEFFLAEESPDYGTRSADSAGFTTVRIARLAGTASNDTQISLQRSVLQVEN